MYRFGVGARAIVALAFGGVCGAGVGEAGEWTRTEMVRTVSTTYSGRGAVPWAIEGGAMLQVEHTYTILDRPTPTGIERWFCDVREVVTDRETGEETSSSHEISGRRVDFRLEELEGGGGQGGSVMVAGDGLSFDLGVDGLIHEGELKVDATWELEEDALLFFFLGGADFWDQLEFEPDFGMCSAEARCVEIQGGFDDAPHVAVIELVGNLRLCREVTLSFVDIAGRSADARRVAKEDVSVTGRALVDVSTGAVSDVRLMGKLTRDVAVYSANRRDSGDPLVYKEGANISFVFTRRGVTLVGASPCR